MKDGIIILIVNCIMNDGIEMKKSRVYRESSMQCLKIEFVLTEMI